MLRLPLLGAKRLGRATRIASGWFNNDQGGLITVALMRGKTRIVPRIEVSVALAPSDRSSDVDSRPKNNAGA